MPVLPLLLLAHAGNLSSPVDKLSGSIELVSVKAAGKWSPTADNTVFECSCFNDRSVRHTGIASCTGSTHRFRKTWLLHASVWLCCSATLAFSVSPISLADAYPATYWEHCMFVAPPHIDPSASKLGLHSGRYEVPRLQTCRGLPSRADGERSMILRPVPSLKGSKPTTGTRIIVVSNRLPLTLQKTEQGWKSARSSGGLASAMSPLLEKTGGEWIGWAGDSGGREDNEERQTILAEWAENEHCFAVNLPPDVAAGFYEGFANQTLWPVFHNFPSQLKFDAKDWQAYVEANRIFCDAVVNRYRPNDLVWVHDYHLMLLPQMLREKSPDAAIGFFLHI